MGKHLFNEEAFEELFCKSQHAEVTKYLRVGIDKEMMKIFISQAVGSKMAEILRRLVEKGVISVGVNELGEELMMEVKEALDKYK